MKNYLNNIRPIPADREHRLLTGIVLMLLMGLFSGWLARFLDSATANLGNIGSQMSIWILLCTIISTKSRTPFAAALRVFSFCVGMLIAYYITAHLTDGIYSQSFVIGWSIFSLFTPLLAAVCWYAVGRGLLPRLIDFGIINSMLLIATVMFSRIRLSDAVIASAAAFFLYSENKRLERE